MESEVFYKKGSKLYKICVFCEECANLKFFAATLLGLAPNKIEKNKIIKFPVKSK